MHVPPDRRAHTTAFVTSVMEHIIHSIKNVKYSRNLVMIHCFDEYKILQILQNDYSKFKINLNPYWLP